MGIPAADIFAALPSASSDKTGRRVRSADGSRAEGAQNGFSGVLQKVRDTAEKDQLRKANDRSHVKEARTGENEVRTRGKDGKSRAAAGADTEETRPVAQSAKKDDRSRVSTSQASGQAPAEESDASSSRITNSGESDSSKETSGETFVAGVVSSISEAEAQLSTDAQAAVPLFLSALITPTTNQQPSDLGQDSEDSSPQGASDHPQLKGESSNTVPVVQGGVTAAVTSSENGDDSASLIGMTSALQTQPVQMGSQPMTQARQESIGNGESASRQSSHPHETAALETVAGQRSSQQTTQNTSVTAGKVGASDLNDLTAAVAPIITDPRSDKPTTDVEQKVRGQGLEHPLLSSAQGYRLGTQELDASTTQQTSLSQRGAQPVVEANAAFRELWSGQQEGKQNHSEGKPVPVIPGDQPVSTGVRPESIVFGASGAFSSSSTTASPSSQAMAQVQAPSPTHLVAQWPTTTTMRAVAFDVIQPDLGHVNIRVAVTNEIVHAYLSADRPEIGQSLISGQDRLQSSLQANGLDMGQFRVDIDRQSAGRSFQEGFSQEQQERGWNQQAARDERTPLTRPYADNRGPRQGLLNVMA